MPVTFQTCFRDYDGRDCLFFDTKSSLNIFEKAMSRGHSVGLKNSTAGYREKKIPGA